MVFKQSLSATLRDIVCSGLAGACPLTQTPLLPHFLSPFLQVIKKSCFCLSNLEQDTRVTVRNTVTPGPSLTAGLCRGCWLQSLGHLMPWRPLATRFCRHKPPWCGGTHHREPAGCPLTTRAAPLPTQPLGSPLGSPSSALLPAPAQGNEVTQKNVSWVR